MRIIVKKINSHWLAQFDDGSKSAGVGSNAGAAIEDLLANAPERQLTFANFKPDFVNSGSDRIIMVLDGSE